MERSQFSYMTYNLNRHIFSSIRSNLPSINVRSTTLTSRHPWNSNHNSTSIKIALLQPIISNKKMALKLDPAILKVLSIDASNTTLAAHGGSGFAFTGKVTSTVDGKEKLYFVKTGKGKESSIMFAGTCFHSFTSVASLLILSCCTRDMSAETSM